MATFTKLKSRSWRAQVRRKGRYIGETFLRREDARKWALEAEHQIDRGEAPRQMRIARVKTFGDLIDLHRMDMMEVGMAPGRTKTAILRNLKYELGALKLVELDR